MGDMKNTFWLSGFWQRVGALLIDTLILSAFGWLLGIFFETLFVRMGAWGLLIGYASGLSYFGVLNSRVGGGMTLGKRVFNLKVVNSRGEPIGVGRSMLRTTIVTVPFLLNGAQLSAALILSSAGFLISMVVIGGSLATLYLYIFNGRTRQSLHDLICGTFVVNAGAEQTALAPLWRPHLAVIATLFALAALLPTFSVPLDGLAPFHTMERTRSALMTAPEVRFATLSSVSSVVRSGGEAKRSTAVNAHVFLLENGVNDADFARYLADVVVQNYPEVHTRDTLGVALIYGYDIGIFSKWKSRSHRFETALF